MDFEQFKIESKKTLAPAEKFKRDDYMQTLLYGAGYVSTEGTEILDHVQRVAFRNEDLDREHLKEELGDLMYAVGIVMRQLDFSMEEILDFQINKNKMIYGDEGYSTHKNGLRKSVPYNRADYSQPIQ